MPQTTVNRGKRAVPESGAAKRWMDFLAEEGYRPALDVNPEQPRHSALAFMCEGRRLLLFVHEDDPSYFQLTLAYDTQGLAADDVALLRAANTVNDDAKVVKVIVDRDHGAAYFQIEAFADALPSPAVLRRSLSQLRHAADAFFERLPAFSRPQARA